MTHPYAFDWKSYGESYRSGAFDMKAGDRIVYEIDGRHGVADEFLQDGDAYVSFDDGSFETVKWNHMRKE